MKVDKFGQMIFDTEEVFDILMHNVTSSPGPFQIADDTTIDIEQTNSIAGYEALIPIEDSELSVQEFDNIQQNDWLMPIAYKKMDICEHVLSLCDTDDELQRCGQELLMYQERNLFDLLRYMKYLVDLMEHNSIIRGVGRGSSVSSYVLYKLKVHRIDSMFYDLDVGEFLR